MEITYWICLVTETGRRFHLKQLENEAAAKEFMELSHGVIIDPVTDDAWELVMEPDEPPESVAI